MRKWICFFFFFKKNPPSRKNPIPFSPFPAPTSLQYKKCFPPIQLLLLLPPPGLLGLSWMGWPKSSTHPLLANPSSPEGEGFKSAYSSDFIEPGLGLSLVFF